MLRADNVICGTSTTGTGTLTLAATPGPPGGIDFDVFARSTGVGFGNSAAIPVSYTIIEYTDATFATAKSHEKGIGTLTLGGSSGIANCTLARTTKQTSATSLNSQPATQNISPGTGISIVTAANTLVFIGASAADVLAIDPYVVTTAMGSGDAFGTSPLVATAASNVGWSGSLVAHLYTPFIWPVAMLAKRVTVVVATAFAGTTCNCWVRLYAIGSNGLPGKLLYDFGVLGTAGSSLNSTGAVDNSTGGLGSGYFMTPGPYVMDFALSLTGKTVSPLMRSTVMLNYGLFGSSLNLANDPSGCCGALNSNTPTSTPDDPAAVGALSIANQGGVAFWLKAS